MMDAVSATIYDGEQGICQKNTISSSIKLMTQLF
jgi:hypothetical protein